MTEPRVVTTGEAVAEAVATATPGTRIPVEVRLAVDDPFAAYRRARDGPGGAFLETTGGQAGWGYFGVDPVERLTVRTPAEPIDPGEESATLAALEGILDGTDLPSTRPDAIDGAPVPVPCGAIGWLSYDVARELETLPETTVDDRGLPRLELAVFDRLAAWETPADGPVTLRITACPRLGARHPDGDEPLADPDAIYERGRERALELAAAIRRGEE